jgi:hypothetical protein
MSTLQEQICFKRRKCEEENMLIIWMASSIQRMPMAAFDGILIIRNLF